MRGLKGSGHSVAGSKEPVAVMQDKEEDMEEVRLAKEGPWARLAAAAAAVMSQHDRA
jgi:hypothetical protein